MVNLSRYGDKNKYGGYTWRIELDIEFHILIHGTDIDNYFVVEFKQAYWIKYKTCFTFVSDVDLRCTIREAFMRIDNFFQHKKNFLWHQKDKMEREVFEMLDMMEYKNEKNME